MNPCEVTVHAQGKKKENVKLENVPQNSAESKRSPYVVGVRTPTKTLFANNTILICFILLE